MDIFFKDNSGNRLGYISGENVKDNGGSRIGYISGESVKDNGGRRIGYISGNDIKSDYGARVGYINGNDIKDTRGNRIGYVDGNASNIEMCAAGLLLFGLKAEEPRQKSSTRQSPAGPESGWEWCFFILLFFLRPFLELGYLNKYTATRGNYWRTLVCTCIYYIVGVWLITNATKITVGGVISTIVFLILSLPIIFVSIRRMHDIGKSGWWNLIPVAGFFMCAFFPGKIENNPYV